MVQAPPGDPLPLPASTHNRPLTIVDQSYPNSSAFVIDESTRSYKYQYSNIYFLRLRLLRPFVEEQAKRKWGRLEGGPLFVPRVLEVEKGRVCFIVGTVYMDMPLKPNVLEDIARDHSIPAPAPRPKFHSEQDAIMLEDESGRICLVGERIHAPGVVTGVILGALGLETNSGDFEVIDYCFAGMAPQQNNWFKAGPTDLMDVDTDTTSNPQDEWIALVSGLQIGTVSPTDALVELLVEFLTGELGGEQDQLDSSQISRVIIAGNSLAPVIETGGGMTEEVDRKSRRYGQDTTTFSPHPILNLSTHFLDVARSIPMHVLPGPSDPSGIILPQQPLPRKMFGGTELYSSFVCETNPTYIRLGPASNPSKPSSEASISHSTASNRTILVNSGQPLDDIFKYLPTPPHDRLTMAESTLYWRHMAPTAPDTLWCHPYFTTDPFVITETPDLYVIGNQPEFETRVVVELDDKQTEGKRCRIVLVPSFRETGTIALVNLRTMDVKTMRFALQGMTGGSET